jgi:hypothetical protein
MNVPRRVRPVALRGGLVLVALLQALLLYSGALPAQPETEPADGPPAGKAGNKLARAARKFGGRLPPLCAYPRYAPKRPVASTRPMLMIAATELEADHSTIATAQELKLGFGPGQDVDVDLTGRIKDDELDIYKITVEKGNILGAACLAMPARAPQLDPQLTLFDSKGIPLLLNDNHNNLAAMYPPISPLPGGGNPLDAALSYVFPESGTYYIQVEPYGSSTGAYKLQLRLRKPPMRNHGQGYHQIVYLDFNGGKFNARALFGCTF